MKRVFMALSFFVLSMMLCSPGQATIQWDPVLVDSNFMIISQGGSFWYPPPTNPPWSNSHLNQLNQDILTEFDLPPHVYPGTATLYSKSSGGILPWGSQVNVYGQITFTGARGIPNHFDANENGMNVEQKLTANIVRKFTNTGSTPVTVDLMAELTGAVNFNTLNFNYDYYYDNDPLTNPILNEDTYAYYLLLGTVTVMEFSPVQGLNTYTVILDNNTWSGSFSDIIIQPASDDYYYNLSTTLYLETHVKNWATSSQGFQSFALDGPFFLGSDPENPLTLTASVPVPPSLVLLLSGLGSLAVLRRRAFRGMRP